MLSHGFSFRVIILRGDIGKIGGVGFVSFGFIGWFCFAEGYCWTTCNGYWFNLLARFMFAPVLWPTRIVTWSFAGLNSILGGLLVPRCAMHVNAHRTNLSTSKVNKGRRRRKYKGEKDESWEEVSIFWERAYRVKRRRIRRKKGPTWAVCMTLL